MKKSGFTIVELLVVICIIALLVLLLLPAITKARKIALQEAQQVQRVEIITPDRFSVVESPKEIRTGSVYGSVYITVIKDSKTEKEFALIQSGTGVTTVNP